MKRNNYTAHIPEVLADKLFKFCFKNYKCEGTPTYGEIFDLFASRNIIITLEPFFTYALKGNIAYSWKISYPDIEKGEIIIKEEGAIGVWDGTSAFGGSFERSANEAIEFAIHIRI